VGQDEARAHGVERVLCEGQPWSLGEDTPRAVSGVRRSDHGGGAIDCHDETRWPGGLRGGSCESPRATPDIKHPVADSNRHHRDEVARRPHEMCRHGHAAVYVSDGGIAIG